MGDDPHEPAPPEVPRRRLFAFMARLSLAHPWLLGAAILASIGVALANIASVALMVPVLAVMGGGADLLGEVTIPFLTGLFEGLDTASTIRLVAVLLVAAQVVKAAFSYLEGRVSAYLKILVERDLRERIFDELLRVEFRYIQRERTANLQTLLHTYPRQSADIVDQYLSAFKKVLTGFTYVLAAFAISVPLTLLVLALGGLSLLAVEGINRAIRRNAATTNELRVRLQQTSLESLLGMKLIRLYAREDAAREKYSRHLREMRRQSFRGGSLSSLVPALQGVVVAALTSALLIAASYFLPGLVGASWVALLALFLLVVARLAQPIAGVGKRRAKINAEIPALEEVYRFLHAEKPFLREGTRAFEGLERDVRFASVSYAYDDEGGATLRDVSLAFPKGRMTAIVGPSGSGKSTLLALLARLADPTSGRVLVDGEDLRAFDSSTWRRKLAFVSQDTHLFQDTVANNIRFARPDATQAEVEAAARQACAHEFIVAMEQGYETMLGERGARLSGGQAQRIALARALLAQPDILVLDEATSALDAQTERDVQAAIESAGRGRTIVVVAHRLSTVRGADQIHVLDAGRVVESGTHDELVARGGVYARLVRMQDLGSTAAGGMRAILSSPVATARLVNGRVLAEKVPVRVVGVHGERDALLRETDDAVILAVGEPHATVRLGGELHASVPITMLRDDGREVPVRPRRA